MASASFGCFYYMAVYDLTFLTPMHVLAGWRGTCLKYYSALSTFHRVLVKMRITHITATVQETLQRATFWESAISARQDSDIQLCLWSSVTQMEGGYVESTAHWSVQIFTSLHLAVRVLQQLEYYRQQGNPVVSVQLRYQGLTLRMWSYQSLNTQRHPYSHLSETDMQRTAWMLFWVQCESTFMLVVWCYSHYIKLVIATNVEHTPVSDVDATCWAWN